MNDDPSKLSEIEQRLELLERENARLKKRMGALLGDDKPDFDVLEFQKAILFYVRLLVIPAALLAGLLAPAGILLKLPRIDLFPGLPLFDVAGIGTRHPGIGFGLISAGGLTIGAIAIGGAAVGILAIGGGAIGVFAMGGGAVGLIALGGGAVGYISVGGGGAGYYVLANEGRGKFVFSRRRQDAEAVEFFTRLFPRLQRAIKGPMPVIPIGPAEMR